MAGYASKEEAVKVCTKMLELLKNDPAIKQGCQGLDLTVTFELTDYDFALNLGFHDGLVKGSVGEPDDDSAVRLSMDSTVFDGMFTGEVDATSAAMSGELMFSGDVSTAMSMQGLMDDFGRIYAEAKAG